jgi:hypothetical protein
MCDYARRMRQKLDIDFGVRDKKLSKGHLN